MLTLQQLLDAAAVRAPRAAAGSHGRTMSAAETQRRLPR